MATNKEIVEALEIELMRADRDAEREFVDIKRRIGSLADLVSRLDRGATALASQIAVEANVLVMCVSKYREAQQKSDYLRELLG